MPLFQQHYPWVFSTFSFILINVLKIIKNWLKLRGYLGKWVITLCRICISLFHKSNYQCCFQFCCSYTRSRGRYHLYDPQRTKEKCDNVYGACKKIRSKLRQNSLKSIKYITYLALMRTWWNFDFEVLTMLNSDLLSELQYHAYNSKYVSWSYI